MIEQIGNWSVDLSKPPDWVGWWAMAISAATILGAIWKVGRRAVFWVDWYFIKPVAFRLRGENIAFRIMIARIAGDKKRKRNRTLALHLRNVSNNLIVVPYPFRLDLKLVGRDFSSELQRADRIGRRWLTRYGADLLVWGYANSEKDPVRLRFVPANAPPTDREFDLDEVLKGGFSDATARALHLQALASLDPSGQAGAGTAEKSRPTPAEERRELLRQAADKSADLLEDPRGLTGKQRAELTVALAEAWFTVVDETGDVRLPPRAVPHLERALEDTAGVTPATAARLHLLLARSLIGDHADGTPEVSDRQAAERAGMRLGDGRSSQLNEAEWRYWRAKSLWIVGRVDEAILECEVALGGVAPANDPELWGYLIQTRISCRMIRDHWSHAALDREMKYLTEAIKALDGIQVDKDISPETSVVGGGAQIAAARLGNQRFHIITQHAMRTADVVILQDAIGEANSLLKRFSQLRWSYLAHNIRVEVASAIATLGRVFANSDAVDASERRSRARDVWRRAQELAAAERRAIDPEVNPTSWIYATLCEALAVEEIGHSDHAPGSLAWALKLLDQALVVAKRIGNRAFEADIGLRTVRALVSMHRLEHGRSGAQGRDDALLTEALELADGIQAAWSHERSPRFWASVQYERGMVHLRLAEFVPNASLEFVAARNAFSAAAAAFAEGDEPENTRICEWWLKKIEQDEQLFGAAEGSRQPARPERAESGSVGAQPLTAPISMPRRM